MNQRVCGAETKVGDPCGAWSVCDEHTRCFSHDPCRERERQAARSRGGQTTAQRRSEGDDPCVGLGEAPPPPEDLEDAAAWASWAMVQNATGRLGNSRARTIAKLLDVFRKALERGEARRDTEEAIQRFEEALERSGAAELKAVP